MPKGYKTKNAYKIYKVLLSQIKGLSKFEIISKFWKLSKQSKIDMI
jgi:hypothetical protein